MYKSYKKSIISTKAALDEFLQKALKQDYIAVDTEFARFDHFWPDLSLVQVAFEKQAYILDVLALKDDIKALGPLLADPNIVKICHSGYQDIETLELATGELLTPYFDTQIAALFLGYQHQISYTDLVKEILQINSDPSPSYLEWMKRPLTDKQSKYAFEDVIYLNQIYPKICSVLKKLDRLDWAIEESSALVESYQQDQSIDYQWQKFSKSFLKNKPYHIAQGLFYWREEEARRKNKPRHRILHNKILTKIALSPPINENQLKYIFSQEKQSLPNQYKQMILDIVAKRSQVSDQAEIKRIDWRREKDPIVIPITQQLKYIRNSAAERYNIIPNLVLTKKDLLTLSFLIADEEYEKALQHKVLSGWRNELLFEDVKKICEN